LDPVTTSSEEEDDAFIKKERKFEKKVKIYYDAMSERQTQLEGHVSVQLMRQDSLENGDGSITFNPRTNKMDRVIADSITNKQANNPVRPPVNSLIQFDDLI